MSKSRAVTPRSARTKRPAKAESKPPISIIDAVTDESVFGGWFRDVKSWSAWFAFLKVMFGLPLDENELATFRKHTGRTLPAPGGYFDATLVVGRRGGKSLILALIAAYLSCFCDWKGYLTGGESGVITIIAADRAQARGIFKYLREMLNIPLLSGIVALETNELLELTNSIVIEIQTASYKTVRGRTVIAALADELAFWSTDEGTANPDAAIIAALKPAMATIPGARLLKASSPYARRGVLWNDYRKHFGKDDSATLIWQGDTISMNPSVPQSFIDAAYAEDAADASAELGAQFRSDLEAFVSREAVEACVIPGRFEIPPIAGVKFWGFTDPSGGSADSMTLAICHREGERAILDAVREAKPPFSPETVVEDFARLLKNYGIREIVGDKYAGLWPRERFAVHGITYETSPRTASDIYRDFLPLINGGRVELLDHSKMIAQLCSLERKVRSGGKDAISHPPSQHDDIINSVAGALTLAVSPEPEIRHQVLWGMQILGYGDSGEIADADENYFEAEGAFERGELSGKDLRWFLTERRKRSGLR
jgi:hypothetical protein